MTRRSPHRLNFMFPFLCGVSAAAIIAAVLVGSEHGLFAGLQVMAGFVLALFVLLLIEAC